MVEQPVQYGGYDDVVMEQLCPVSECLVGGNDGAAFFISVCNESEEQVALLAVDGGVAHLINDDQA